MTLQDTVALMNSADWVCPTRIYVPLYVNIVADCIINRIKNRWLRATYFLFVFVYAVYCLNQQLFRPNRRSSVTLFPMGESA